jgi:hypothetical protein
MAQFSTIFGSSVASVPRFLNFHTGSRVRPWVSRALQDMIEMIPENG